MTREEKIERLTKCLEYVAQKEKGLYAADFNLLNCDKDSLDYKDVKRARVVARLALTEARYLYAAEIVALIEGGVRE